MVAKPALRLASRLYRKSPAENLARLQGILSPRPHVATNDVLDEVLELSSLPALIAWKLSRLERHRFILLGDARGIAQWRLADRLPAADLEIYEWDWEVKPSVLKDIDSAPAPAPGESTAVVICRAPTQAVHWDVTQQLRAQLDGALYTIGELTLGFTRICELRKKLAYFLDSFDDIARLYLGHAYFGPLERLDQEFSLSGRRVVEFGCFDGYQTLGLTHLGAEVTCIEARAENAIKTRAAADALGFDQVKIKMDDFHNATPSRYGKFDLAFAHGVYYHAIQPLAFLQNLTELADNVFVGGFCATDEMPAGEWRTLTDGHREYRAKSYTEGNDFTAGVNDSGYFFDKDDLQAFFEAREYDITVISDEPSAQVAGRYLRFLAQR